MTGIEGTHQKGAFFFSRGKIQNTPGDKRIGATGDDAFFVFRVRYHRVVSGYKLETGRQRDASLCVRGARVGVILQAAWMVEGCSIGRSLVSWCLRFLFVVRVQSFWLSYVSPTLLIFVFSPFSAFFLFVFSI